MSFWPVLLIAGTLQSGPGTQPARACALLSAVDIQRVQDATLKETKPSNEQRKGLQFGQCVYATTDFAHSVSVTLITADRRGAVQRYWEDIFRETEERQAENVPRAEKDEPPARRMSRLGTEAFWTGDARAGALYVLGERAMLRISVGGVADEAERIRRSRLLATAALRRLN